MSKRFSKLKCWLGFHKWKNIDTTLLLNLREGESYCYFELHKCEECGKEQYLGMGHLY